MEFQESDISSLDIANSPKNLARLIVRYLCGKNYDPRISKEDKTLLLKLVANIEKDGLSYRQFNELLLLLNQDTVSRDFFDFFFGNNVKTLDDLKKGIVKFRGFAMLCFGNFKFAYRQLIQMDKEQLMRKLALYCKDPSGLHKELEKRPSRLLQIKNVARNKTWYLGEITGKRVEAEIDASVAMAKSEQQRDHPLGESFGKFMKQLSKMDKQTEATQKIGITNTDIYLTWDYMDVYIATSMRNKWEYEETFDFLAELFADDQLRKLNLRYFDPTQSICSNPRDKGLLESLMLKRARCAIYLAQESDTMGKDSELAAMLAQGKPVIAYIPRHNPQEYAKKIAKYPLNFFKRRISILDAEEIFDYQACTRKLTRYDKNFKQTIADFTRELIKYHSKQPLSLWTEKEAEFKRKSKNFKKICQIVAIAESFNFDMRAELLKGRHPLCIQVDLKTGVANGVLVVRSPKECAELLYHIFTNQMKFTIDHVSLGDEKKQRSGYTQLEEEISGCAFRVVTDYERLTNSFWNLFDQIRNNLYTL